MGLSVIVMLIEALLCNVMLQPTADTDVGAIEMVLLVINIFVLIFSVFRSIGDKDDEQTKHQSIG